jgi:hypothetical protein
MQISFADFTTITSLKIAKYGIPISSLSHEQFPQNVDYSQGSIRNQIVHLVSVDGYWFRCLISKTTGAAQIAGDQIGNGADSLAIRNLIGLVPDNFGLYEELSAYEILIALYP